MPVPHSGTGGDPRESAPEAGGQPAPAEERQAMLYCPVCSLRLEERGCKLRCPRCGYYMSCADYV